ncbi:MAG: TlpA disulfide reductase family protein [Pyrinomonadaceae bacterium]
MKLVRKFSVHSIFAVVLFLAASCFAQGPKEIFRDSDGNLVSNNEFVDIRMANFNYPDATIVKTLPDGTKEFQLQKIPQEGMAAPVFSVKTLDGGRVDMAMLKGKVVVLNFWFIGCASCRAHQPKLNELKSKFAGRDDVVFLAITADPAGDVKKYLSKERFDYPQTTDADALIKAFRVAVYPKNIVINKNGEIVYWRSTIAAWDKFESVIRAELAR